MLTGGFESCGCSGFGDDASPPPTAHPKPPWLALALGALGLGAVVFVASKLAAQPREARGGYTGRELEGTQTIRLPKETMEDIVWERRR